MFEKTLTINSSVVDTKLQKFVGNLNNLVNLSNGTSPLPIASHCQEKSSADGSLSSATLMFVVYFNVFT